ncbi:hypothetical protein V6N12_042064 [Hibiscus sabdariffa]|uniref:Uncharacterized protein n=1 Tax=Hibiscus sabdariffa TaxID=183260 RepID=A0ABR2EDP1_9ROSI
MAAINQNVIYGLVSSASSVSSLYFLGRLKLAKDKALEFAQKYSNYVYVPISLTGLMTLLWHSCPCPTNITALLGNFGFIFKSCIDIFQILLVSFYAWKFEHEFDNYLVLTCFMCVLFTISHDRLMAPRALAFKIFLNFRDHHNVANHRDVAPPPDDVAPPRDVAPPPNDVAPPRDVAPPPNDMALCWDRIYTTKMWPSGGEATDVAHPDDVAPLPDLVADVAPPGDVALHLKQFPDMAPPP